MTTNLIIIGVVILFIAGIMFLNSGSPSKKKSREDLLADLAKVLEGKLVPIEDYQNSYRISFDFEGYKFNYEDIEAASFKDKIYKSYIKISTTSKLTLTFGEKKRTQLIEHSKTVQHGVVRLPKELQNFGAFSNNPPAAEVFLDDVKVLKILKKFQDVDTWGRPMMAVKISSGTIIVEFDSTGRSIHKALRFVTESSVIEEYLDDVLVLTKKLEAL
ncbi:MAG: hypothetical protein AB7S78_10445 [Candidatus Omnitrophota bacterium]